MKYGHIIVLSTAKSSGRDSATKRALEYLIDIKQNSDKICFQRSPKNYGERIWIPEDIDKQGDKS